jgi:hypothetical protein
MYPSDVTTKPEPVASGFPCANAAVVVRTENALANKRVWRITDRTIASMVTFRELVVRPAVRDRDAKGPTRVAGWGLS